MIQITEDTTTYLRMTASQTVRPLYIEVLLDKGVPLLGQVYAALARPDIHRFIFAAATLPAYSPASVIFGLSISYRDQTTSLAVRQEELNGLDGDSAAAMLKRKILTEASWMGD